jgi:hypothetical protein
MRGFNTALSRSGNALSGIPALRKIKFFVWINPLAADDPIIHTFASRNHGARFSRQSNGPSRRL